MRVLAVFSVICGVLILGAPRAMAVTEGLSYTEDTIFTVGEESVAVVTTAVMSNTSEETRSGNTIYYSYFDSFIVVTPVGAEDLTITSRGATLKSTAEVLDSDFEIRTAVLPTELRSGESRTFTVTYTLPRGEIRDEEALFFSNPAFHAFPLWSFSDPGTGSILLRVPEGAEMSEFGSALRRTGLNDGYVEWAPLRFSDPENFFTFVTVTLENRLQKDSFTVLGQDIELQTWPGDDEWAAYAKDTIVEGLPALEEMIGLPIPDQSTLEVTESVTPYYYGYGGWYDQLETSIEVGNELDRTVMIHELSHAWFNDDLFTERWVSEGLAEEFTWHIENDLGWVPEEEPAVPDITRRNSGPLVEWGRSLSAGVDDEDFRSRELYGYNASWYVVREMTEIIGMDAMRDLLAAADGDITAYPDENAMETTSVRDDWKRVLDLASSHATSEGEAKLDELFIDFVVSHHDIERLEERRQARIAYRDFAAQGVGWGVPHEIRSSMDRWQFDEATALMIEAGDVHERYIDVFSRATEADLELSDAAQISFERNAPDFALALNVLTQQDAAIDAVEKVRRTSTRALTTEERWGLRDISRAPYVDIAETAFVRDDLPKIERTHDELERLLVAAADSGAARLLWTKIGGGALVGILLIGLRLGVRRRKQVPTVENVVSEAPEREYTFS